MSDTNTTPLLREAINHQNTAALARRIKQCWPQFNSRGFNRHMKTTLDELSLGGRCEQVRLALREHLPDEFNKAMSIILESLGPELAADSLDDIELGSIYGFINWPLSDYAAYYGLDHFDMAMHAFYEITKRFSAEGSIRYFLKAHPEKTVAVLHEWAIDSNVHVRRLVSEGTRPILPMCMQLPQFKKDPTPVLALLEKLRDDPALYVRRSVANNLNEIAKDNPDQVTDTLARWNQSSSPHTPWLTRHALRTLIKQGNPQALALLGYPSCVALDIQQFRVSPKNISLGKSLNLSVTLVSQEKKPIQLMIDYVVHHMKANGKTRPKVFKWAKKTLRPGETLTLKKRHSLREITTRKYYAGKHEVELQINGQRYERREVKLLTRQRYK